MPAQKSITIDHVAHVARELAKALNEDFHVVKDALRSVLTEDAEALVSSMPSGPKTSNPPAPPPSLGAQVGGDHYQTPIQHAEFCQRNQLTWCEASATKYLCRHRKKNKLQDALKALHYTLMMLDFEYPQWRKDPDAAKLIALAKG